MTMIDETAIDHRQLPRLQVTGRRREERTGILDPWRERAACRAFGNDPLNPFYPHGDNEKPGPKTRRLLKAKAVCDTCPVFDECEAMAELLPRVDALLGFVYAGRHIDNKGRLVEIKERCEADKRCTKPPRWVLSNGELRCDMHVAPVPMLPYVQPIFTGKQRSE